MSDWNLDGICLLVSDNDCNIANLYCTILSLQRTTNNVRFIASVGATTHAVYN